ncbi:competence type IV pilus minor pilin ComGD [Halobacillus litoralis]|uniref:Competence protein ComG n=1 Tax=Halobacillus litoralis TaxID=45668 RepID=A0A410MHS5_9BACI|nr:competence type IV pilus minor pilin ComGD [Halobacillus litoralis]QAS54205.1 competence protein ComG [Halobacillus litoralis]
MGKYQLWGNNYKGYTFTEMIIVLLCWSVLLSSIMPLHHRTSQQVQASLFIQQFQEDVLLIQQLTMQKHAYHMLLFEEETNEYKLYDAKNKENIFIRKLPDQWRIKMLTLKTVIQFNQRGMINQAGTMRIETPRTIYRITFPFGTSRVRIEKE